MQEVLHAAEYPILNALGLYNIDETSIRSLSVGKSFELYKSDIKIGLIYVFR